MRCGEKTNLPGIGAMRYGLECLINSKIYYKFIVFKTAQRGGRYSIYIRMRAVELLIRREPRWFRVSRSCTVTQVSSLTCDIKELLFKNLIRQDFSSSVSRRDPLDGAIPKADR